MNNNPRDQGFGGGKQMNDPSKGMPNFNNMHFPPNFESIMNVGGSTDGLNNTNILNQNNESD